VVETVENSLGEITSATLKKGATGELVSRNVECLVPLLTRNSDGVESLTSE